MRILIVYVFLKKLFYYGGYMFIRKFLALTFTFAIIGFTLNACAESTKDKTTELKNYKDSLSYALGFNIGDNLRNNLIQDSIVVDFETLSNGFRAALNGKDGILTKEEVQQVMLLFQQDLQARSELKKQQALELNKKQGEEFLAENAKKEGVITTSSGLQYKIIKEGSGKKPTPNSTVKVHYTGKLIDGKVFDSSVERGKPVEFKLNGVIPGWTEGLQFIGEGGKIILYIPSDLAYGKNGAGQAIPPNATLIFEVELLEVK